MSSLLVPNPNIADVAIHELGHAGAGIHLGWKVDTVSIQGDVRSHGRTHFVGLDRTDLILMRAQVPLSQEDLNWACEKAVIAVSGVIAERVAVGADTPLDPLLRNIPKLDQVWAKEASLLAIGNGKRIEEYVCFMQARVEDAAALMRYLWPYLSSLVPVLVERQCITGAEVEQVVPRLPIDCTKS